MEYHLYNSGIMVAGTSGTDFNNKQAMPFAEGKTFVDEVVSRLDKLNSKATGKKLLKAIKHTGKRVTIYAYDDNAPAGVGGKIVTNPQPQGLPSVINSMITPFRGNAQNVGHRTKENPQGYQSWKTQLNQSGLRVKTQQAKSTFGQILRNIALQFPSSSPYELIAKYTGMKVPDVIDVENGYRKLTDDEYYRIAFCFYDCMVPGAGINCSVRYTIHELEEPEGTVALGHELIHAWRKMAGRCVVQSGWEEEAMTTGLWLFSSWEFTENRLRDELGLSRAKNYGCSNNLSSNLMTSVMAHVELGAKAPNLRVK